MQIRLSPIKTTALNLQLAGLAASDSNVSQEVSGTDTTPKNMIAKDSVDPACLR